MSVNYTPTRIDETQRNSLTRRQQLAQVRHSLTLLNDAEAYWPCQPTRTAVDALAKAEAHLADEIRKADLAAFGSAVLRPTFVNGATGLTMHAIVAPPNSTFDMPHVSEATFDCMRRCLGEGAIEVRADYDVYVVRGRNFITNLIPRSTECPPRK